MKKETIGEVLVVLVAAIIVIAIVVELLTGLHRFLERIS